MSAARPAHSSSSTFEGHSPNVPGPLLDAEGAARLLNVPASWVLAEARADRIPHVRLGRYVRFDGVELAAWWQSRARGPWRKRGLAAGEARRVAGSNTVPSGG
jgi:excisionase family DNA binding protein